ncbi:MAG: cytochrome c oxidase assembly protein [Stenotrophobium sp.]
MSDPVPGTVKTEREKRAHLLRLLLLVGGFFGFGFLLGPMYGAICSATGTNGYWKEVKSAEVAGKVDDKRWVTVQFMTTVNGAHQWDFKPEQSEIRVHPGMYYTVDFYAKNLEDKDLVAQGVPKILPLSAATRLHKTECFCFSQQAFKPNELKHMPVRFVIDASLPKDVDTVTLSYTFFDVTKLAQQSADKPRI